MDLEILAEILRLGGHEVFFSCEPDIFGVTDNVLNSTFLARRLDTGDRIFRTVMRNKPDVCIFSALPASYKWCRAMAERLKKATGCGIVFTGLHATLVPERILSDDFVDVVIQGEIENVILPLLDSLASDRNGLERVGNLWIKRDGKASFTFRADLVDLDKLPLPDKELFRTWVSHSYSYAAMVSRGCPFRCSYCEETCHGNMLGSGYFRRKSVSSIIAELEHAKRRYGFKEVIFKDSYLTGDIAWLAELMNSFKKEIGTPFKCFCAISGFDERTADLLKDGGCYCIEFGLQTWNDDIRRKILNRAETAQDARAVFKICADRGLWYDVDHMFGLPGETEADHRLGAGQYGSLLRLNRIKPHHLVLLPGAPIVEHAVAAGADRDILAVELADGIEKDFYQAGGENTAAASARLYAKLYKILPALPAGLLGWLLEGRRIRLLKLLPRFVVILIQALLAARSRDLRFAEYLRHYPERIFRAVFIRGS